jgi:hypothetical protein
MVVSARARGWAAILLAAYTAIVATVAVVPRQIDSGVTPTVRGALATLRRNGLPSFIDIAVVEGYAHVVLLIPFGILAVVAVGRRFAWAAMLVGVAAGVGAELAQSAILELGVLERRDMALNALGALVGSWVGYAVLAGLDRSEGRELADVSRTSRRSS